MFQTSRCISPKTVRIPGWSWNHHSLLVGAEHVVCLDHFSLMSACKVNHSFSLLWLARLSSVVHLNLTSLREVFSFTSVKTQVSWGRSYVTVRSGRASSGRELNSPNYQDWRRVVLCLLCVTLTSCQRTGHLPVRGTETEDREGPGRLERLLAAVLSSVSAPCDISISIN